MCIYLSFYSRLLHITQTIIPSLLYISLLFFLLYNYRKMADNQEELFVVPDDMFAFVSSKSRYVAVVHKSYVYIAKLIQAQLAIGMFLISLVDFY